MKLVKCSEGDVKVVEGNKTTKKMAILQTLGRFSMKLCKELGFYFSPIETP